MAEGSACSKDGGTGNGPSMDEIASKLLLGQSKSKGDTFISFSALANPGDGPNRVVLVCQHCRCQVLKPGYATLVEKEVCNELPLRGGSDLKWPAH